MKFERFAVFQGYVQLKEKFFTAVPPGREFDADYVFSRNESPREFVNSVIYSFFVVAVHRRKQTVVRLFPVDEKFVTTDARAVSERLFDRLVRQDDIFAIKRRTADRIQRHKRPISFPILSGKFGTETDDGGILAAVFAVNRDGYIIRRTRFEFRSDGVSDSFSAFGHTGIVHIKLPVNRLIA